jgi:SAM-dependent methyltransferase
MYDRIAFLYDLLHEELKDDILFTMQLADLYGMQVLELGCGTGRLVLPLARTGHHIVGLDQSQAMIRIAEAKIAAERISVQQRAEIVEGDMSSFNLGRQFDLILIPHNTLMHLNPSQMQACFGCVLDHLRPAGRLLIDVDNPVEMADFGDDNLLYLEQILADRDTGKTILQMASSWVDTDLQIRHTTWIFDTSSASGGQVERIIVQSELHFQYAHQLDISLQTKGMKIESMYGDYDKNPYDEESPRLLLVAKRESN